MELKFEGGGGSTKTEYGAHLDTSYDLEASTEKNTTIEEETTDEQNYEIGPGGHLKIYQLCLPYLLEGVVMNTACMSTSLLDRRRLGGFTVHLHHPASRFAAHA